MIQSEESRIRKYHIMLFVTFLAIAVVSITNIVKLNGNAINTTLLGFEILFIMGYNLYLGSSLILFIIYSMILVITNNSLGSQGILIMSLLAYMVYIIRLLINERNKKVNLGDTKLERLSSLIDNKINTINIDTLYLFIIVTIMITVIINQRNSIVIKYMADNIEISKSLAFELSAIMCAPAFTKLMIIGNAKSYIYLKYIELVLFTTFLINSYIKEPAKIEYLYQAVIYIIMLGLTIYSIWYSNEKREEN